MKNIYKIMVVLAAVIATAACKKSDSCSITFPVAGAFVQDWGQTTTVKFNTVNVKQVDITSVTGGWSAEVDLATKTIKVTAPESAEAENAAKSASITLSAISSGGSSAGAILSAYIIDGEINLSEQGTSNCYIITKPNTKYRFDVTRKGEEGDRLATADIGIVWQSATGLIKYLTFNDGYAEFFAEYESGSTTEVKNGNLLIAAYNDAGDIIWSWHLWFTKSDPRDEVPQSQNRVVFMQRNLGAYDNSDGSTDTAEILGSYGLYYQWGRKDPFPRPATYNCANNSDEILYSGSGSRVYVSIEESDAKRGNIAYTIANPTVFITSTPDNGGDWLYGHRDDSLWSDHDGSGRNKSVYDPCPYGWQVPGANDFAGLRLAEEEDNMDLELAKKTFGWFLTDSDNQKYFYTGAGYRSYYNGILSNVNYKDQYPYTPVPWVGYYWTQGISGANGVAMFFDLNTTRATINAFEPRTPQYRANAMQVRCVKSAGR